MELGGGMAGVFHPSKQRSGIAWDETGNYQEPKGAQSLFGSLHERLRQVPQYVSFSSFRRAKERQQQGAPVFETTRARGKQLAAVSSGRSYRSPTPFDDEEDSSRLACLSRCSNGTSASDNTYTISTRAPSTEPSSRPSTRQEMRSGFEGVMEIQRQEVGEDKFTDIVLREQRKQEWWEDYVDADSPKKVISDFEEHMRRLHDDAADQEILDLDLVNSTVGFTRRTPREELISSYARQCRETYSVPLGPRQCTGAQSPNESVSAAQLATPEMLNYSGWSLGSERLNLLCNTSGKGMKNCRHCDLSGNRIQDKSVSLLCEQLLPTVETLNLSHNELGRLGARALAEGFELCPRPPLIELNLENNRLGDAGEKHVCEFVDSLERHCPLLRGLSLAQNNLGKVGAGIGRAIGAMLRCMLSLKVLDLHWNHFHGLGAYHMLMGIYDNGQDGGVLSRLDLSWNRLGKVDERYKNAVPARVLADVLEDHKKLFHLDVSYNNIGEEDCAYLATSLRSNHTLFGLHISGNHAAVDSRGFLIPCKLPSDQRGGDLIHTNKLSFIHSKKKPGQSPSNGAKAVKPPPPPPHERRRLSRRSKFNSFRQRSLGDVRRKVQSILAMKKCGEAREEMRPHALDLAAEIGSHPLDSIHLRAEHCWICDHWRQVMLAWTPGVSGSLPDTKVQAVYAFISLDNFTRPIQLHRKVKNYAKHQASMPRWEGFCMVPPPSADTMPLLVLFQVNTSLEFAKDMTVRVLAEPMNMCPVNPETRQDGEAHRLPPCKVVAANEIPMSSEKAVQLFEELGVGSPVVINEDQVHHGKVNVLPRTVVGTKSKPTERWTKAVSSFMSWREPDESLSDKMLERDLQLSKVLKFSGEHITVNDLKKVIAPFYPAVFTTYRALSVQGSGQGIFGVGLNTLVRLVNECDMLDETVSPKQVAHCAATSIVVDRRRVTEIRIRSDNSVIRYQFLETFLRIADLKYVKSGRAADLLEAAPMVFKEMFDYTDAIYSELQSFQKVFFVEEVDMVFRAYANLLHAIYDIYANFASRNTSVSGVTGTINIPQWYDFLHDCDAFDDRFVRRKAPLAFLMGMQWQVDEVTSDRHMHMGFVEFLVAVGAIVFMRQFWHEEEFADLIEEFCEDRLRPLLEEKGTQEHKASVADSGFSGEGRPGHPGAGPSGGAKPLSLNPGELRKAFQAVFRLADEDDDGVLTLREFRSAFRNPKTSALLGGRSFKVDDFLQIFDTLDSDGNRVLTIEEAMMGFAAIRRLELTADRAKAFLNQLLVDADRDGDGEISNEEFRNVVFRMATQRKLLRLSLDSEVVYNAFIRMQEEKGEMLDSDTLIEAIMKLRTPKSIPRWKIILKQIFQEADRDFSGSLTKEEFRNILNSQGTQTKFYKIGISKLVLEGLFDVLDQDGSNDLTEDELLEGFEKLLESGLVARGIVGPGKDDDQKFRKSRTKRMNEVSQAVAALGGRTSPVEGRGSQMEGSTSQQDGDISSEDDVGSSPKQTPTLQRSATSRKTLVKPFY